LRTASEEYLQIMKAVQSPWFWPYITPIVLHVTSIGLLFNYLWFRSLRHLVHALDLHA